MNTIFLRQEKWLVTLQNVVANNAANRLVKLKEEEEEFGKIKQAEAEYNCQRSNTRRRELYKVSVAVNIR